MVSLNQRLSKVAVQWLEPEGPDSAMAWGFFDPIFEQKEYGEAYVVENLAREMMAKDPKLKTEFEQKIENDPAFAASPYCAAGLFLRSLALVRRQPHRRIPGRAAIEARWASVG